jgi:hypothetical protein
MVGTFIKGFSMITLLKLGILSAIIVACYYIITPELPESMVYDAVYYSEQREDLSVIQASRKGTSNMMEMASDAWTLNWPSIHKILHATREAVQNGTRSFRESFQDEVEPDL